MIEIIAMTLWSSFIVYAAWYFTSAKHYASLTQDEAKTLWKIHQKTTNCNAKSWRKIQRGRKIVGFACKCGYKYIKKRPIAATKPQPIITQPITPIYQKLHKP